MVRRLGYDDLDPELQALLGEKYARLGYLGEFFQVAAHQPAALAAFIRFTSSLAAALPAALGEVIALAVSTAMGNDYERFQHERLALRLGFSEEWIRAAEGGGGANVLDKRERATRRLAVGIAETGGQGGADAIAEAEVVLGPELLVAEVLCVARFVAHATVVNAFGFEAPVASSLASDADARDSTPTTGAR